MALSLLSGLLFLLILQALFALAIPFMLAGELVLSLPFIFRLILGFRHTLWSLSLREIQIPRNRRGSGHEPGRQ
jgi:hypothetical protein